jgi:hypothetical protein
VANLRKLVASALNSSDLSSSDIIETAIDRIGALAFSDSLGSELWALKYAGDARSWSRALLLLSQRSKRIAPDRSIRTKICGICLGEWLDELCRTCAGRRLILASSSSSAHVCTTCGGTGLKRHSDLSRMRDMGLERGAYRRWEHKFALVHARIADADTQVWYELAAQLGRVPTRMIREKVLDAPRRLGIIESEHPGHNENSIPDFVFCSTARA